MKFLVGDIDVGQLTFRNLWVWFDELQNELILKNYLLKNK